MIKKIGLKIKIVILFLSLISFSVSSAQVENTFKISWVMGNDLIAPTVPTNIVATAISSSQIDISWTASTDNSGIKGYEVWRDGVFIATTTSSYYSDIQLSSNTSYSYIIKAVDIVDLYSTDSEVASATTLSVLIPKQPFSSGQNTLFPRDLSIIVQNDFARISWNTVSYASTKISWGLTKDYELGASSNEKYIHDHMVEIKNLLPGHIYFYKIESIGPFGGSLIYESQFITLESAEDQLPANVSNLFSSLKDKAILLSWKNPTQEDFIGVRILRSDKFYPKDINDGKVVFEGKTDSFLDNSVSENKIYYYTVFSKNSKGLYSSGSVIVVKVGVKKIDITEIFKVSTSTLADLPIDVMKLSLKDFIFVQDQEVLEQSKSMIDIDGSKDLKILIKYDKVPEVLKTIAVTIQDPIEQDKIFTFLLRVDNDKSKYEAIISPIQFSGKYHFAITVMDYKNQAMKNIYGILNVNGFTPEVKNSDVIRDITDLIWAILIWISKFFSKIWFCINNAL